MSIFDSIWDTAAKVLDAPVDKFVGDRMRYRRGGVWLGEGEGDQKVIAGFILDTVPALTGDEQDEISTLKRVKVPKALIDRPDRSDRIEHPRLGTGLFQPGAAEPQSEGRYWVFDVQKAR